VVASFNDTAAEGCLESPLKWVAETLVAGTFLGCNAGGVARQVIQCSTVVQVTCGLP
jgi:hypothetical protein